MDHLVASVRIHLDLIAATRQHGRVLQRRRAVVQSPVDVGALVRLQQLRHVIDVSVGAGVDQLLGQPPVKAVVPLVLAGIATVFVFVPGLSIGPLVGWFIRFSFSLLREANSCYNPNSLVPGRIECLFANAPVDLGLQHGRDSGVAQVRRLQSQLGGQRDRSSISYR